MTTAPVDLSPATIGTLTRVGNAPSPATAAISFGQPKSAEEATNLLAHAERLVRDGTSDRAQLLALIRFLGANDRIWSSANRERLQGLIARLGEDALNALLIRMTLQPRTDVLDACEGVLRRLPAPTLEVLRRAFWQVGPGSLPGHVRAATLGALVRSIEGQTEDLVRALNDRDGEVRAAAADLMSSSMTTNYQQALEKRRAVETDALVIQAIGDALGSAG
jgi:hypothetical protein